ncbi:MAG: SEL1-like repeat protein [Hyphomonas sp.]|nr:SEL1-like repeat protein [Hyphomonas sp.]
MSESQTRPWSVKGIDERAREAAREAAVAEGLTLGEYLNRLLMASDGPQPNEIPDPVAPRRPPAASASDTLDRLTRRIEAAEARSTLAITGMDHTIHGLVSKLESSEMTTSAIAGHVEGVIEDLRETHDALQRKVRRLEEDDSGQQNLEALKALEQALGKLASHVYDENELAQQESIAIKGRVESGFAELGERVESMEAKVESTLTEAARRVERAVEQAELRAEGTARHLAERMTTLETNVEKRLVDSAKSDERLDKVEADVSGALDSMEGTLVRIQERLNRAETTTDTALKSLESTFAHLDERIETVAAQVDPDLADRLRSEFEARFEDMMSSVRSSVDNARKELAEEITQAASGNDEALTLTNQIQESLEGVQEQIAASEERQSRAMETVSTQVNRLGASFDTRLADVEARAEAVASDAVRDELDRLSETVTRRIDELAAGLGERVSDSERRSASAIEQIGDQVATATSRLQLRQNESMKALAEKVEENRRKAEAHFSDTLGNVTDRLDHLQAETEATLSPVQKAIASLAARLESLEDFNTPPFAETAPAEPVAEPGPELAVAPPLTASVGDAFEEVEDFDLSDLDDDDSEDLIISGETDNFEAGLESWSVREDQPSDGDDEGEGDGPYRDDFDAIRNAVERLNLPATAATAIPSEDEAFVAGLPEDEEETVNDDPLDALAGLDDAHTEARESDIFDDEEFDDLVIPEIQDDDLYSAVPPKMDESTADYLSRARRAAMTAASSRTHIAAPAMRTTTSGGSRLPLYAAGAAAVVAGAAVGGYLYMRGKQDAPVQHAPASTYVDPGTTAPAAAVEAPATLPDTEEAEVAFAGPALEDDLFETTEMASVADQPESAVAETSPPAAAETAAIAAYAPVPEVVTVAAAAASGNSVAQYQLGQDKLAAGDFATGADFIRRSAQKGLPIAQYALAKLHEKGTGVPKDLKLAREWTQKAAAGGNVKAMHDLAVFMAEGDGGEQTFAGAVEWFRKGAEYGIVDSQYNLGILYEQGLGISPNLTEALFWFEVAKANGDGGAPAKVAELAARVSPEAAAQAHARAESWRPATWNALANGRFGAQPWNLGNPLQVQAVQNALNALGYAAGDADGIMGSGTAQAIRTYQQKMGLDVTGTVTPDLIDRLNAGASAG